MAVEVSGAALIHKKGGGLAHIVKERRQPQGGLWRHLFHRFYQMGVHIPGVVGIFLVKSHRGGQLGHNFTHGLWKVQQDPASTRTAEQTEKLPADALPGHHGQPRRLSPDGLGGVRMDGKVQLSGQPKSPEDAQSVLLKAALRLSHAADEPGLQVGPAAETVCQPVLVPGHGVDGKVPPGQVLRQAGGEGHLVGVAAIGVGALPAEGGHLYR